MKYRRFGRLDWQVSEIGYGMWGMAGWTGSDDEQSLESLQLAIDLGCNFFDTAWAYGSGKSEQLLGQIVKRNPTRTLYTATKVPPKNRKWPSQRDYSLDDVFPPDYIREYTERSLANLNLPTVDLLQFHVWEDAWVDDDRWVRAIDDLKREGLIRAAGVSLNRWEPWNGVRAVRSGVVDAVQVIYNIFDQAPEDELFPTCREYDVAVIARVPFDEGSLTGMLTKQSKWPEGDWRNSYFVEENLNATVERVDALRPLIPAGLTMAEMALDFILANPDVATVIPGMRKSDHVRDNIRVSDGLPISSELLLELRAHRWDRKPASWSQ